MSLADCITSAKEMGFDAIEFTDLPGNDEAEKLALARELRLRADEVGLPIVAYAVGACLYQESDEKSDAAVERLCAHVRVARELGTSVMRHDVCYSLGTSGASRSFDLMLPCIARNTRRVTEYAERLGIRTCTENHGLIAQDSDRLERLFNAVNHDNYGLLVDIGNFICVDEDPIRAVSRVAPYAIHAHAKDFDIGPTPDEGRKNMTRGCNFWRATAIGEGCIPVRQCLAILKRSGYDGYVSVEYEGADDCIEGITKGKARLEQYLTEI